MATFRLTIEASVDTATGNAPVLEILVNGITVTSSTAITAVTGVGSDILSFTLDFDDSSGNFPSSLSFRFPTSSGDAADVVTLDRVLINGREATPSSPTITRGNSSSVNTTTHDHLFGREEPVTADLGTATYTGDGTDEIVVGESGTDVIIAGGGEDRVEARDDDDAINGEGGNDTLFGQDGNDIILGGAGNDLIRGNNGDDLLFGQADNDRLFGDAGNDVLNGGSGNDVLIAGTGDDILYGEDGDDRLVGQTGNNIMYGDGGDDFIIGGNQADTAYGGDDNDTIHGGQGDDLLYGEDGNDLITGSSGSDTIYGGDGIDTLKGGADADTIYGGADADDIDGDEGNDTLQGDGGNDTIDGGDGDDTIQGGTGNDILNGNADNDTIHGGTGADTIDGGDGDDVINGAGITNDVDLFFPSTADLTSYSGGQDGAGSLQIIEGGNGFILDGNLWKRIIFNYTITSNTVLEFEYKSTLEPEIAAIGFETDDNFSNDSNRFKLYGTQTNGMSYAAPQATFAYDGSGDWMSYSIDVGTYFTGTFTHLAFVMDDDGGGIDGNSWYRNLKVYDSGTNADDASNILNGGAGDDTITAGDQGDTLNGGADNDTLTGDAGDDTLTGGTGVDTIDGAGGDDTINLANGDFAAGESLTGGADTDEIVLTNATTVDLTIGTITTVELFTGSAGADNVTMSTTQFVNFTTIDLAADTDTLNVEAVGTVDISADALPTVNNVEVGNLTGSTGNDDLTILATQLNAIISGSGIIDFDNGTDILNLDSTATDLNTLGAANDASVVGLEQINFSTAAASVTVDLSAQSDNFTIVGGNAGNNIDTGTGNDVITGGDGVDTIITLGGGDEVTAGLGADTINTGGNNDIIYLANGDYAAGELINGGANNDRIILTDATTIDFRTGTVTGVERLYGSGGDDTVTVDTAIWLGFDTLIDLDGGTDILNVTTSGIDDISASAVPATITNIETGNLIGSAGADDFTVTGSQLDAIISGSGTISFDAGTDILNLDGTSADLITVGATDGSITGLEEITAAAASAITNISLSGQTEAFTVTGSNFADTLTLGSGNDTITGGTGADNINGGNGNDTINLANGDFAAGETIDGGANTDEIVLTNATTVDFTAGTLSNLETLTGSGGDDDVTMSATQYVALTTIDLAGGTDVLNVFASGDISASGTPAVSNTETGNLVGDGNNNSVTMTGAQLDNILIGAGTMDLGGGTGDVLNLTSTSADLNALGNTDGAIAGIETISAAGAGAAVNFTTLGQTENLIFIGGDFGDTLITGTGNDTINGGDGNDIIAGFVGVDTIDAGDGDDTIILANGNWVAGESTDGGTGTDTISFFNASTVDFTIGTLTSVEILLGNGGNDTVTMSDSQWTDFTTINMQGGTDNLFVVGTSDISGSGTPAISNTENSSLIGTTGNDTSTMTGAQLNAIIIGTGTINFDNGTDTLNLTSASSDLATLAATDGSIQGLETISFSTAASGITLDLSAQTEDFTLTGTTSADTLTTGSGDDVINHGGTTIAASITAILAANPEAVLSTDGWISHIYTTVGNSTFTAPVSVSSVDYLIVAGGGGGGGFVSGNTGGGGGGGGGDADEVSGYAVTGGSNYNVTVGGGGAGGVGGTSMAGTGGNSSFDGNSVSGGGGGGTNGVNNNGANGGTGGGGRLTGNGGTGSGGGDGGDGSGGTAATGAAGGGGGAGGNGSNASGNNGGAGGIGIASNITGDDVYYGGGGGGGAYLGSGTGGAGGAGGGGTAPNTRAAGEDGVDGRGGGGSGATGSNGAGAFNGGDGGDGIVIISYNIGAITATTMAGSQGNDDLYGASGMDIFAFSDTGAGNVDTIYNFDAQMDKLDLSDLLTGYDPLTEAITDFVRITDSGGNSDVRVDTTGSGSFGAGTVVAVIDSVTGLTNESLLESTGVIIA